MRHHLYDVLLTPVVTEKNTLQNAQGKYTFHVQKGANKTSIKEAVEKVFNVHVTRITTRIMPGKWKRVRFRPGLTKDRKKATVTLKPGEKIEFV